MSPVRIVVSQLVVLRRHPVAARPVQLGYQVQPEGQAVRPVVRLHARLQVCNIKRTVRLDGTTKGESPSSHSQMSEIETLADSCHTRCRGLRRVILVDVAAKSFVFRVAMGNIC